MSDLPKRDDPIYQEIESFEDYELTQCVAYEMAIRNKNIIRLKAEIDELLSNVSNEHEKYCANEENEIIYQNRLNEYEESVQNAEKNDNALEEMREPCYYDNFYATNRHIPLIKNLLAELKHTYWYRYFYENDILDEIDHRRKFNFFYAKTKIEKLLKEQNKIDSIEFLSFSKDDQIVISKDVFFEDLLIKNIPEGLKKIFDSKKNISDKRINIKMIAPRTVTSLVIPKKYDKSIKININLALPLNELEAQIRLLKNSFDNDSSIIQSPIELLGVELQEAEPTKNFPKKPKAVQMADMFFIYDYVTARMQEVEEYNERYKTVYQEKLHSIKNNKDLSTIEKKIQELEAKKEYYEAKSESTIKTICEEDEVCSQVNLKGDRVYQLYLAIKPYIEECRYKELLTGVSVL